MGFVICMFVGMGRGGRVVLLRGVLLVGDSWCWCWVMGCGEVLVVVIVMVVVLLRVGDGEVLVMEESRTDETEYIV